MEKLSKYKVFIAEPINGLEDIYEELRKLNCELIIGPPVSSSKQGYSEEQLINLFKDIDAFIGMSREKITRRVISSSLKLRIICKYGNGVDNIDVNAASDYGIVVSNSPVHNMTVAEFTFALLLAVLKKIPNSMEFLKFGGWRNSSLIGDDLYKKTIGIIGFGTIAKQLVKRLQGWDTQVLVYNHSVTREIVDLFSLQIVDWETIFKSSDIITLHLPLTESTRKIVGTNEFNMMKKSAILINTSRGPIVDESALIKALKEKNIRGAGLDVFEQEPISKDNPLLHMKNVVLTPHVGGYSEGRLREMALQSTQNCIQALKGRIPEFVVNSDVLPKWKQKFQLMDEGKI